MDKKISELALLDTLVQSDFRSSIVTTYNCYFPFYENVVLPQLRNVGCIHNILFMDSGRCSEAYSKPDTRPKYAGREYVLIPVKMNGAFHPKIVFQVGKNKGQLHIGSHNMTYSGFGLNDEITNRFLYDKDSEEKDVFPFVEAYDYLYEFVPKGLTEFIKAYDGVKIGVPWLSNKGDETRERTVLYSDGSNRDLWGQVVPILPRNIKKAFVSGPFFDQEMELVKTVADAIDPCHLIVGIDPQYAQMGTDTAEGLAKVRFVNIKNVVSVIRGRDDVHHQIHAKIMWFKGSDKELLITGSANPSSPAYLANSFRRNAEVIVADSRNEVGEGIGMDRFLEAPELSNQDWKEIKEQEKRKTAIVEEVKQKVLLAIPDREGYLLTEEIPKMMLQAFDLNGVNIGKAESNDSTGQLKINANEAILQNALYLTGEANNQKFLVLVHVAEEINNHYGSELRRTLLQVLGSIGSLEGDSNNLAYLLELTDKFIVESEDVVIANVVRRTSGKDSNKKNATPVETLEIEAAGRGRRSHKNALASGDVAILLDALLYRLGMGLSDGARARIQGEEKSARTNDEEPSIDVIKTDDRLKTASACRSKVGKLVRRIIKQLKRQMAGKQARQNIVLLSVVLVVIRWLRKVERNDDWRELHLNLVNDDDELELFRQAVELIAWKDNCVLSQALNENKGEWFRELSLVVGLLVWLGWKIDIDLVSLQNKETHYHIGEDEEELEETDIYYYAQLFASIGAWLSNNQEAQYVLNESIEKYTWGKKLGKGWLDKHLLLFVKYEKVRSNAGHYGKTSNDPHVGDLAILGKSLDPRVRVVLRVENNSKVIVYAPESDNEDSEKAFLTSHIALTPWI